MLGRQALQFPFVTGEVCIPSSNQAGSRHMCSAIRKICERVRAFFAKPSRRYASAFLLGIPLFAFLYSLIPHGFYQSNIKIESVYTDQAQQILNNLCSSISSELPEGSTENATGGKVYTQHVGAWSIEVPAGLKCERLRLLDDERFAFTVTVQLSKTPKCPAAITDFCFDIVDVPFAVEIEPLAVKSPLTESREFVPPNGVRKLPDEFSHAVDVRVGRLPLHFRDRAMVDALEVLLFGDKSVDEYRALILDANFEKELSQFISASSGFTSDAPWNCLRMLYFSVVTISTLGYGDIVPLTLAARLLVTAEVIFGIIFAGLFVNASWNEADAKRRNDVLRRTEQAGPESSERVG